MTSPGALQVTENEALIESSFRRLLSSIESEREKIRSTWGDIDRERATTASDLDGLRVGTEQFCLGERQKIEGEWKRLDTLRERMSILSCDASEMLEINCSGTHFSLPKSLLVTIEGSYLNHMFSDAFIQNIPLDANGRFFLDFNPVCFGHILQYLRVRHDRPDAIPTPVAPEQQQNMDLLAEALRLKAFMPLNRINPEHGTSLKVSGVGAEGRSTIEASHVGWQVISAAYPLPMAGTAYFEVRIGTNCEARGGLAVGICGHIPHGAEVHSIRLQDCVMYNSAIGLIGDAFAAENVTKGIVLAEGSTIGVRHNASSHSLEWFYNRSSIGTSAIRPQSQEKLLQIYPVVALGAKAQKVEVNFVVKSPLCKGDPIPAADDD